MDSKQISSRPAQILLVEDNNNDVELTCVAFEMSKLPFKLHHVMDGVDCMAFLRKEGEYVNVPTPDLILLDLNMPRKNGREVLTEMMADEILCYLRVIVLTDDARKSSAAAARCGPLARRLKIHLSAPGSGRSTLQAATPR